MGIRLYCGNPYCFTFIVFLLFLWMTVLLPKVKISSYIIVTVNLLPDVIYISNWTLDDLWTFYFAWSFPFLLLETKWYYFRMNYCLILLKRVGRISDLQILFFLLSFQRYRYTEAYLVDLKLKTLEQEFISNNSVGEEVLARMRSAMDWRGRLIVSCINFLGVTPRIKNIAKLL